MHKHLYKLIASITLPILFILPTATHAQAIWDLGLKGGETFYLGDKNRTLFNDFGPAFGAYIRYNWNTRWVSKLQFVHGKINSPIDKSFNNADVQMEFNFFPYGEMKSHVWSRYFTPYICAGVGLVTFDDKRDKMHYAVNIPFGVGVKCKVFNRINVGLEWTMHKMFNDNFDDMDNPNNFEKKSSFANKDWFSIAMIYIGVDLGKRGRFCR